MKKTKNANITLANIKLSIIDSTETILRVFDYDLELSSQELETVIRNPTNNKLLSQQPEQPVKSILPQNKLDIEERLKEVGSLVEDDNPLEAIKKLKASLPKWKKFLTKHMINDIEESLIHFSARYKRNEKSIVRNTISRTESNLEWGLIIQGILQIIRNIRNLYS